VVAVRVRNSGGRALDVGGELRLTGGPGGLQAGPFPVRLGTTLGIGEAGSVRVPLDPAVPAGPWRVRIRLGSGAVQRSAGATITFPGRTGSAAAAVPATSAAPRSERRSLAVGVGLLLLGGLMLLRRRGGRRAATGRGRGGRR
jgi:hypothetical protein